VTGIDGIGKALRREKYVTSFHPQDEEFIYIWFLAVDERMTGKGIGSSLLQELINKSNREALPIFVETSSESNLLFYHKHGFENYHISDEEMFGFKLYFLKRVPDSPKNTVNYQ
jgi:ribosomal protein S18 acetylase RimI-like enzyme